MCKSLWLLNPGLKSGIPAGTASSREKMYRKNEPVPKSCYSLKYLGTEAPLGVLTHQSETVGVHTTTDLTASQDLNLTMAHLGSSSHTISLQAQTGIQLALSPSSGCKVSDQAHIETKQESSTALTSTNQRVCGVSSRTLVLHRGRRDHWALPQRAACARCQAPAERISADSLALFRRKAALAGVG